MRTYTLWTNGRKIGETRLELRPSPRRRSGAFYPTQFGLGILPDLRAAHDTRVLELRDPTGAPMAWDSIAITDLAEMVAAAAARHPGVAKPATLPDAIKFVISLTLPDAHDDARVEPPRELFRDGGSAGEHSGAQRRQTAAH